MDKNNRPRRGGGVGGRGGGAGGPTGGYEGQHRPNSADMPLRMVVDARLVGAIIGQGGANIREITKDSKARCVYVSYQGFRMTGFRIHGFDGF